MHLNVQSLNNKIDLLHLTLNDLGKKVKVLCFTEHWLSNEQMSCVNIEGYSMIDSFCRDSGEHGGCVIFVDIGELRNAKSLNRISKLSVKKNIECSAVKFYDYCILNVYRPPSGNFSVFLEVLSDILFKASETNSHILLCGDLNVDALKETKDKKMLFDVFSAFSLVSLINEPTRIANSQLKTTASSIDFVVANNDLVRAVVFEPGYSDHLGQLINFGQKRCEDNSELLVPFRDLSDFNVEEFKSRLSFLSEKNFEDSNINDSFSFFIDNFNRCFSSTFPLKYKNYSAKSKKIRFSNELLLQRDELEKLGWLRKHTSDKILHSRYNKLKKIVQRNIKQEKITHNSIIINTAKNKTKAAWSLINTLQNKPKKQNCILEIRTSDRVITDNIEIANEFGEYLSNIIKNKLLKDYFGNKLSNSCTHGRNIPESMYFFSTTPHEIRQIIDAIPNKKSTGPDSIPIALVKECKDLLSPILSILINRSVEEGFFPNELKKAEVVPIFKKGERNKIENYRPIALLSVFSKIFERVLYERTAHFLDLHNAISLSQHGFRKGYSTESASAEMTQHIFECMDRNECVVVLLFDLTRAFDSVDVDFVCVKLDKLGVRGNINNVYRSFLTDRPFCVKIGDGYSKDYLMELGTPQGSILGPLIFTIFINDLIDFVKSARLFVYCDDTTAVISDPDPGNLSRKALACFNEVSQWCKANNLMLNHNKTQVVEFYNKHKMSNNFVFNFEGHLLSTSDTASFLGLVIDKHMGWSDHIDGICKRLNKSAFLINQLKKSLAVSELKKIYYSSVYNVIGYNIILWGKACGIDRVFVIQKRIIRLLFSIPYRHSCRDAFRDQNILTVAGIFIMKSLMFIYKNRYKLQLVGDHHLHDTRGRTNLLMAKHKHEFFKKSPFYMGSKLFNMLPEDLKKCHTLQNFKSNLKKLLFADTFYTVEEFESFLRERG